MVSVGAEITWETYGTFLNSLQKSNDLYEDLNGSKIE